MLGSDTTSVCRRDRAFQGAIPRLKLRVRSIASRRVRSASFGALLNSPSIADVAALERLHRLKKERASPRATLAVHTLEAIPLSGGVWGNAVRIRRFARSALRFVAAHLEGKRASGTERIYGPSGIDPRVHDRIGTSRSASDEAAKTATG